MVRRVLQRARKCGSQLDISGSFRGLPAAFFFVSVLLTVRSAAFFGVADRPLAGGRTTFPCFPGDFSASAIHHGIFFEGVPAFWRICSSRKVRFELPVACSIGAPVSFLR